MGCKLAHGLPSSLSDVSSGVSRVSLESVGTTGAVTLLSGKPMKHIMTYVYAV